VQSTSPVGTRIACIPIHRLPKDFRQRTEATVAKLKPEIGTSQSAAACNCQPSGSESPQSCTDVRASPKNLENTKVVVSPTPSRKCSEIAKTTKIPSPVATDCTVSLSRLVLPDMSDVRRVIKTNVESSANSDELLPVDPVLNNISSDSEPNLYACAKTEPNETLCNGENPSGGPIVYPSCDQSAFLGSFGLANRAELPHLRNAVGNRLHREIGGKLRRSVKPNRAEEMVYRRTNSMRCISFDSDPSGAEPGPQSLHCSRENSQRLSLNVLGQPAKRLSPTKRLKPYRTPELSADVCKTSPFIKAEDDGVQDADQSSLSILADMALADFSAVKIRDNKCQTPLRNDTVKPKVRVDVVKLYILLSVDGIFVPNIPISNFFFIETYDIDVKYIILFVVCKIFRRSFLMLWLLLFVLYLCLMLNLNKNV